MGITSSPSRQAQQVSGLAGGKSPLQKQGSLGGVSPHVPRSSPLPAGVASPLEVHVDRAHKRNSMVVQPTQVAGATGCRGSDVLAGGDQSDAEKSIAGDFTVEEESNWQVDPPNVSSPLLPPPYPPFLLLPTQSPHLLAPCCPAAHPPAPIHLYPHQFL